uniref:Uncharacterized protein n=1 Tax=Oryza meridionalis TaxID=40149 RepID=A0A0E0E367_9ORYZ
MAAAGSIGVYKAVFAALGALMLGTLVYTCVTDGSPFRLELLTPWLVATLIDFYVNVTAISTWVIYKEVNWISSFFWVVLLYCFGSIATCAYVVVKLFEIKTSGPSQDPLDLLFLRWMAATLLDFYINVFAISVWVAHKESNWISTAIWICLLICFGSITTCGYIVIQLFQVSYQDPIYHWEPWSWSRSFMRHKLEQFVV